MQFCLLCSKSYIYADVYKRQVYIVVDGDKADIISGKDEILKPPCVGILPAQPGQVFNNYSGYAVILYIFHHLLKARPLEAASRISVVYKKLDIPKPIVGGVFAEQGILVGNGIAFSVQGIVLAQAAV